MKRMFEIEFPDSLGSMWMNVDNLMLCINAYCKNQDGNIKATDVTDMVNSLFYYLRNSTGRVNGS